MKETLRHKEAFEYYYSLGDKRSFKLVEGEFKVSNMSVARWSKSFNWQDRIGLRDINNSKKIEAKTDETVVNSKADYRALIRKTVDLYKQKLKEGKIIINRPQDLETLAKLDLTLMGEATDINEMKGLEELDKKLALLTLEELKKISKAHANK